MPLIEWCLNRYGGFVLAGILPLAGAGCTQVDVPAVEPPVPLVRTATVLQADEHETLLFPGIAKEAKSTNLSFRVSGELLEFNVKVGQRITKDTVIARLDPRDYALTIKRYESEYTAALTALETADANLKRLTSLLADNVASQVQFDTAKTQYDAAKGQIEGLTAQLDAAKNALSDTALKAPFDGIVVQKLVENGENVGAGNSIVSFYDVSHLDLAVNVPEDLLVRFKDITDYQVEFESFSGKKFPAALKELGLAIQPGKQTYPMEVRADLPKDAEIFPGMTAMVQVKLKRQNTAQRIPLSALFGNGTETSLWIVEDGKVQRRNVKIVNLFDAEAEIDETLPPSTKIVTAGVRSLHEGQAVQIDGN